MDELDDILGEMDCLAGFEEPIVSTPADVISSSSPNESMLIQRRPLFEDVHCLWFPAVDPPHMKVNKSITNKHQLCIPSEELKRVKAVSALWNWLKTETSKRGHDVHTPTFERWLLTTRHYQHQRELLSSKYITSDPILASNPTSSESVLLGQELCEAGCQPEEAHALVEELCHRARAACLLLKPTSSSAKLPPIKVSVDHSSSSSSSNEGDNPLLVMESNGVVGKINKSHYDKLCQLWEWNQAQSSKKGDEVDKLVINRKRDLTILSILLRYNALSGGSKDGSGGGFQGALHGELFKVLNERLGCSMECFASPLNCSFGQYCSAFPDVDGGFGSVGSFFDFKPKEGCFEANPPFVPLMVEHMASHINELLSQSTKPLCFIVVIPFWEPISRTDGRRRVVVPNASAAGWQLLKNSTFLVKHIKFGAQEHGYCEGSQHVRATRFKTSRFESSMFILQNEAAKDKWRLSKSICDEIKAAFNSRFNLELEQRKTKELSAVPGTPKAAHEESIVSKTEKKARKPSNGVQPITIAATRLDKSGPAGVNKQMKKQKPDHGDSASEHASSGCLIKDKKSKLKRNKVGELNRKVKKSRAAS